MTTTRTTVVVKTKGTKCGYCGGTISRGANAYVYGADHRHTRCPAPDASVAVSEPTPVVAAPVAHPAPAPARTFGALSVDGASFRAWESDYENEGR